MSKDRYSDGHTIEVLQGNEFLVTAANGNGFIKIHNDTGAGLGSDGQLSIDTWSTGGTGNIVIDAGGYFYSDSIGFTSISSGETLSLTSQDLATLWGEGGVLIKGQNDAVSITTGADNITLENTGTSGVGNILANALNGSITLSATAGTDTDGNVTDITLQNDSGDVGKVLVDGKMKILTETGGQIPLTVRHDTPDADQIMFRIKNNDTVVFSVDEGGDVVCNSINLTEAPSFTTLEITSNDVESQGIKLADNLSEGQSRSKYFSFHDFSGYEDMILSRPLYYMLGEPDPNDIGPHCVYVDKTGDAFYDKNGDTHMENTNIVGMQYKIPETFGLQPGMLAFMGGPPGLFGFRIHLTPYWSQADHELTGDPNDDASEGVYLTGARFYIRRTNNDDMPFLDSDYQELPLLIWALRRYNSGSGTENADGFWTTVAQGGTGGHPNIISNMTTINTMDDDEFTFGQSQSFSDHLASGMGTEDLVMGNDSEMSHTHQKYDLVMFPSSCMIDNGTNDSGGTVSVEGVTILYKVKRAY